MVVGSDPSGGGGGVEVERRFGGWGGWEGGSGGVQGRSKFFLKKNDIDGTAGNFFSYFIV